MLNRCSSESHTDNLFYVDFWSKKDPSLDGLSHPQDSSPIRYATNQKESENLLEKSRQKCEELEIENQELRILLNHAQTGSYSLAQRTTILLRYREMMILIIRGDSLLTI